MISNRPSEKAIAVTEPSAFEASPVTSPWTSRPSISPSEDMCDTAPAPSASNTPSPEPTMISQPAATSTVHFVSPCRAVTPSRLVAATTESPEATSPMTELPNSETPNKSPSLWKTRSLPEEVPTAKHASGRAQAESGASSNSMSETLSILGSTKPERATVVFILSRARAGNESCHFADYRRMQFRIFWESQKKRHARVTLWPNPSASPRER